jgi:hypothetical protein
MRKAARIARRIERRKAKALARLEMPERSRNLLFTL